MCDCITVLFKSCSPPGNRFLQNTLIVQCVPVYTFIVRIDRQIEFASAASFVFDTFFILHLRHYFEQFVVIWSSMYPLMNFATNVFV